MAALAASAVTLNDSWFEGGLNGKRNRCRALTLVLTGQGDATDTIGYAALGFTRKIAEATPLIKSDDSTVVVATPSYDGSKLLLKAAGTNAPGTYSGTFKCIVKGD